jgi:2',3'-cyclic-nucleotide 2'-phosphodiesterase/3'-nucleotidase
MIKYKLDENGNMIWSDRYNSYTTAARYYNYDSAAGIDYTVDLTKPEGSRVEISGFTNGNKFNVNSKYKVAINSYRASGGGGHLTKGAGLSKDEIDKATLASTSKDLRFHLMKWIEKKGTVQPKPLGNWKVIPAEWWKKAKKLDYQTLYEGKK